MKMQLRGLSDVLDAAVLGPFRSGGRHGTDALLGARQKIHGFDMAALLS